MRPAKAPGIAPISVTTLVCLFLLPILVLALSAATAAQTKGTFRAAINYAAGPPTVPSNTGFLIGGVVPLDAHVADIDGDGKPDIVAAVNCSLAAGGTYGILNCAASGSAVIFYRSNGDGTFLPGVISGGPAAGLRSMAIADFNGDGKPDVVAASDCLADGDCSSGTIAVLLGNGDGTFSLASQYNLNGIVSQSYTLAVGDLNGDGKADVVAGIACYDIPLNGCSVGSVSIFLGNGDGTLADPIPNFTVGNGSLYPVVGDFNGDGHPDVIAGGYYAPNDNGHSSLTILLGAGNGTFSETVTPLPFFGFGNIAAVDLNSDGKLDLVVTANAGVVYVFPGNGDASFQDPVQYTTGLGFAVTNGALVVATDLNGDGKPDVIVSGTLNQFNGISILLNDGNGGLIPSNSYTAGGWLYAPFDVADVDGDGKSDVIVVSGCEQVNNVGGCPDGTLTPLLGNGDGTLRGARYLDTSGGNAVVASGWAVAAADFNGDGFQDLVYPACESPCQASGFALLRADGAGGYAPPVVFSAPVGGSRFVTVGDFNADGKPDLATFNTCDATCSGASSVSIFLNAGGGSFQNLAVYDSGGTSPFSITTGDFNGDGKRDIALLEFCGSCGDGEEAIGVLLGNGDGSFQSVQTMLAGSDGANWIAAADFDGDLKTDLVMTQSSYSPDNPYQAFTRILISKGDGTFTFGQIYDTGGGRSFLGGSQAYAVATGDVNGDGKADIVVGNSCEPLYRGQIPYDVNCANGSVGVLLGNGTGTFQPAATQIVTDGNLFSMSLADVNADSKLDEIASTATGVMVAFGNGNGTFQSPTIYAGLFNINNIQLAVADLNNDGGLDIVQPGLNGQLAVLYSQGFSFPVATLTPVTLTFPNQLVGTPSAAKLVTLSNTGTAALHISSIIGGGDFSIVSNTCGATLAVHAKCKVKVTFSPSVAGTVTGQLVFTDDAPSIHQTVPLTGTGVLPATLSPTDVIYPSRKVGTTSPPKAFNLTNNQNVALTNIAISSTGDFAVSSTTCTASLPSKGKCKINVTFNPSAKGQRVGQLIVSDSAINSPQTANLTGTGK